MEIWHAFSANIFGFLVLFLLQGIAAKHKARCSPEQDDAKRSGMKERSQTDQF